MKRTIAKLAFSCLLGIALLEGLFSALCWFQYRTIDIREIERIQSGNANSAAEQVENFRPSPYFSYIRAETDPDRPYYKRTNNVGTTGRDFPLQKTECFTVLVVGGSVGRDVSIAGEGSLGYLETMLSDRLGCHVTVLTGTNSAWTVMQAESFYSMYGGLADALVSVTGFNECRQMPGPYRIEYPYNNFHRLNPMATEGFDRLGHAWACRQIKDISLNSHSRAFWWIGKQTRLRLEPSPFVVQKHPAMEQFALPSDWDQEQRIEYNRKLYLEHMHNLDALAARRGVPRLHVIQPVPAIGKSLTDAEKHVAGDLWYGPTYNKTSRQLLLSGIPILDLREVFADHGETIYCDGVHCMWGEHKSGDLFRRSPGYKLMCERIAEQLHQVIRDRRRQALPPSASVRGSESPAAALQHHSSW